MVLHLGEHDGVAGPQVGRAPGPATRLSASVAFLVNTTVRSDGAPMKPRTLARAPSSASVASSAIR